MDPILYKAARDGNVQALQKLVQDDPLILESVAATSADTPMHVAAMLGNLQFARELIKHKSNIVEYLKELNQHGFSPMHLACANGHLEVARLLIQMTKEVCSVKGKDGMSPLHCAAMKGRVGALSLILEASKGSVSEVNDAGETALHLAVKNNQIGSLQVMVEMLKRKKMLEIVNSKDEEGNTVLHLAAARRNYQVIEKLVSCNSSHPGVVEVNGVNKSGLTALDIVALCPGDIAHGYADIESLLRSVGAERGGAMTHDLSQSAPPPSTTNPKPTARSKKLKREDILRWEDYFRFQFNKSSPNSVRNALLVVAVLMATATYQAGLSPPGGIRSDEDHRKGEALLASYRISFIMFIVCNSAGFYVSMNAILILTYKFPMCGEMYVAFAAIVLTYDTSVVTFSPPGRIRLFTILTIVLMPIAIPMISYYVRRLCKHRTRKRTAKRKIECI